MVGMAGYPFADTDGVCGSVPERGVLSGIGLDKENVGVKRTGNDVLAGEKMNENSSFYRWPFGVMK